MTRALILQPPLVLADEPTGNLDSESGEQAFQLLRDISARFHTTFVIVTHDEHLAKRCDRIVRLVDGGLARDTSIWVQ